MLDLERRYVALNRQLVERLHRLVYLTNLQKQSGPSTDYSEEQLQDRVKIKLLVLDYLQTVAPVLMAVYGNHDSGPLAQISDKLDIVYGPDGLTAKLIERLNTPKQSFVDVRNALAAIEPQMRKRVEAAEERQERQAANLSRTNLMSPSEVASLATRTREVIAQWRDLSRLCDLLPMLISAWSLDWGQDNTLMEIIEQCQEYGAKLDGYLLKNYDALTDAELVSLELE